MEYSFIDHLVFAVANLSEGTAYMNALLGVKAIEGGRHPGFGTRNALVSLGGRTYLEIVAPDPDQPEPDRGRPFELDDLTGSRLVTWAAKGNRLSATVEAVREDGIDLGAVQRMSRTRPDGVELAWTLTDVYAHRCGGVVPFLIDWGDTEHPVASLPVGCRLLDFTLEHPDALDIRRKLDVLGFSVPVQPGAAPRLRAKIQTPMGVVDLK